jgi:hypothetical protein
MNTTYAQQGSPPHDMHIQRTSIPNISDAAYRNAAPGASQYPLAHSMPLPQQSQINPTYGDPFNPLAVSRAPIPEGMHAGEGLAPLAPGTAPQAPDPLPRSIVDNGKRYEYVIAYYGSLPAANSILDSELYNNLVALECAGLETRYELRKESPKKTCMYIH